MFLTWCLIVGVLLLFIGLSDTWRRDMPIGTSALYLLVGYLLGPQVFDLLRLQLFEDTLTIERLTEAAVLISLFAVGLRLRASLRDRIWITPLLLASVAMVMTMAALVGIGMALGFSLGAAVLLAAVLAPTDPVLASEVQVEHARDRDRLRFSLTGEGGLNDGTAFPFVMLGLGLLGAHELGPWGARWWAVDVLWAIVGGLAIGWSCGWGASRLVIWLRRDRKQALGMESFLTLGLIALTYGISVGLHSYGFLAVFAAGLAMRIVEQTDTPAHAAARSTAPAGSQSHVESALEAEPAAGLPSTAQTDPQQASAYMAHTVLDFALDLEKLAELTVMLLIGSLLTRDAFSPTSLAVAAALIFVARPLAVYATTWKLPLSVVQRRLAAWFGIRGIGSMYYLAYAITHGGNDGQVAVIADAVLVTITLSVLLHGSSATPVMRLYQRMRRRPV